MGDIEKLASFLMERNEIDRKITEVIHRPAEKGHISEWIASKLFPIKLNYNGREKGYDGIFMDGTLEGKKVNVKYYSANQHIIDLNPNVGEDIFLLILTGPYSSVSSSKDQKRPFCISNIYLFNERNLCNSLQGGNVKVGVGSSVRREYWEANEIYPEDKLGYDLGMKRELLSLFSPE